MRLSKLPLSCPLLILCLSTVIASCSKDEEEARKFPSSQPQIQLSPGPLTSIKLDNGITAYFQEEHWQNQVAVEVIHRVGAIHEGEDKVEISLITTLMLLYSESESFGRNEAINAVQKVGKINAETVGNFTHYDYIVPRDKLDLALQIEAERLAPVNFTEDVLEMNAPKCAQDLDYILSNPRTNLLKYGLKAFNQAYNYRKTFIPIYRGANDLTIADVKSFHEAFYRPGGMVIVITGDFDTEEAKALVKARFEKIPPKPAPALPRNPVEGNHEATWDIDATVMFFAFPGPYRGEKERMVLSMLGAFLNHHFSNDEAMIQNVKTAYASNYLYPVDEIPFFVFVQLKPGLTTEDAKAATLVTVQNVVGGFNENLLHVMKENTVNFVEASILKSQFNVEAMPYFQIIGQEALNVGIKHLFKNDVSDDEFVALVQSISFEEAKEMLESRFIAENMKAITIRPQGK